MTPLVAAELSISFSEYCSTPHRRILHFNVTHHPTGDWIVQQLREALPDAPPYRYAIFDHVIRFLKSAGLETETHDRAGAVTEWHGGNAGSEAAAASCWIM